MNYKEAIVKIKNELNIVDYIKSSGVNLNSTNTSTYKGLCPFHNEKTPSFTVNEDFQNYKCFGCGEGGDIFSYVQHMYTIDFREALTLLANECGIEIDKTGNQEDEKDIYSIQLAVKDAAEFYHEEFKSLNEDHVAKIEISKRGLPTDNSIYGYATGSPNKLYTHLSKKGYSDEVIHDTELVIFKENKAPWDFFHSRLLITISDYMGRPVSFTSRHIYDDDKMEAKYINGKDSAIFHKKSVLFNLDKAKKSARSFANVFVTEGQFDVISMVHNGYTNTVAASGTSFTKEHVTVLERTVGSDGRITFLFDGDDAGITAAYRVFTTFPEIHDKSYAVLFEGGSDPCDYFQKGRHEEFKNLVETPKTLSDFVVDLIFNRTGKCANRQARSNFISKAIKAASVVTHSSVKDSMLGRISILSATPISTVRKTLDSYNKSNKKEMKPTQEKQYTKTQGSQHDILTSESVSDSDKCFITAFALMVRMPKLLKELDTKKVPKKYHLFLKEFLGNMRKKNNTWRFLPDEYTNKSFALGLIDYEFLEDPRNDEKWSVKQFQLLINQGDLIAKKEQQHQVRANSISTLVDEVRAEEIAKTINLVKSLENK